MMEGVSAENFKKTLKILQREEAIMMSKQLVKKGDIVLIAGKGHETTQEINGQKINFNDVEVVQEILKSTEGFRHEK